MQLISCGSISVKNHSFDLIPSYKPRFSNSKFPSPLFSTSFMLGEFDCLQENPKLMSLRLEDKEYFSGSLVETKLKEGDGNNVLKRTSSNNDERICNEVNPEGDKEEPSSGHSKCIPRSITSLTKQLRIESMKSPISDGSSPKELTAHANPQLASGARVIIQSLPYSDTPSSSS
ncbi:hypothetical protein PIB30_079455 [Stylosanthes scabra]|uniref:Uncharacterized protein n=1 Tax=Stylosanthes scabra TaxID=79078 RepID=A0ABU6SRU1_9FABA|nr:hypothetical protein [Stylosanthes scabra]